MAKIKSITNRCFIIIFGGVVMSSRLNIIASLYRRGQYKEILKTLEREISKNKEEGTAIALSINYYRAISLVYLKKHEEAIEVFNIILESNLSLSSNYQCRMLRGYLFTCCSQYQNAEKEFLQLLEDGYESVMICGALGHIAYNLGKKEASITYLEKALSIDPNNMNVLNSMSYILAEYDMDFEKALTYIEKVIKKEPRNTTYLDTYGYILFKKGSYEEAKKVFSVAYKMSENPLIKEHLITVEKILSPLMNN